MLLIVHAFYSLTIAKSTTTWDAVKLLETYKDRSDHTHDTVKGEQCLYTVVIGVMVKYGRLINNTKLLVDIRRGYLKFLIFESEV